MKYVCSVCGYVYDEEKEKVPFAALPDSWVCPLCGAVKSVFMAEKKAEAPKTSKTPVQVGGDMKKLSAGELSSLFSNLARGCEKQYKGEEAVLFRQIAEYFAAGTPSVANADMENLAALIQNDLNEGYQTLRSVAVAKEDRGTQRICVWGEKVTNILGSLVTRYQKEGEAFLKDADVWVCTVCGFIYIGSAAPALCPVCKVPAWKFEKIEGRISA